MRLKTIPLYAVLAFAACTSTNQSSNMTEDYTQYVNPFIGTDFTGNTYPGAQVPFGMVQLSPDNGLPGWDRISGYFYPDSTIAGFSHTHLSGTGAGDLYDVSFMPVTLPYKEAEAPLGIHSKFSHANESAYAGYYQVKLDDYNINVELTATETLRHPALYIPESRSSYLPEPVKGYELGCDTRFSYRSCRLGYYQGISLFRRLGTRTEDLFLYPFLASVQCNDN